MIRNREKFVAALKDLAAWWKSRPPLGAPPAPATETVVQLDPGREVARGILRSHFQEVIERRFRMQPFEAELAADDLARSLEREWIRPAIAALIEPQTGQIRT